MPQWLIDYWALMGFGPTGWGLSMLRAAGMTIAVSSAGFALGSVLGALAAWGRLSGSRIAAVISATYTTVIRGIPELLVIYLVFFGGAVVLGWIWRTFWDGEGFVSLPAFVAGFIAVGICNGAYQAEVFRGAFRTVARGEIEAAAAFGMPRALAFRRIVAPQVLRFALPGLGNCWQLCLKESALISVTGLVELLRQSFIGGRSTRDFFSFLLTGAALYLVITTVSSALFAAAERRALRGLKRA
ncbi:ABC transporter permease [Elioraea thermophila]|uniref:ABC transporter permease n=1 Tax=Elioraea thermophila TaxID=2185104 RepID=UPI0018E57A32|nr:ABC transporter permease subunit [Elioraea thermophila]